MSGTSREWRLIARPHGEPTPDDFELATTTLDDPGPGRILVRNDWLSVDPYMRGRMNDVKSYMPPFALGAAMTGGAVGTVVASQVDAIPVGAIVSHFAGWREHAVLDEAEVQIVDTTLAPPQAYLGVLGTTGLTAYAGLVEVAPVQEGDVVFVSGAAGAVGSVAGQIAGSLGASRVIGSAGGPDKIRTVVADYGFDAAIDYREGHLTKQLAEAAPAGIDVYFDNVGGDHLQAAIAVMNTHGRIALCGAISVYNDTTPRPGPNNLPAAIGKRLTLRGMLVSDHMNLAAEYIERAVGWMRAGTLRADETVYDGIENTLAAFTAMMKGFNTGKMLVRLHR